MATLLDWLVLHYPTAKRQTLKRMIEARRVLVNGVPARTLRQPLAKGAAVIVQDRTSLQLQPSASENLDIIFEDSDILVVNKPPGLLTSTVPRETRPTLLKQVRAYVAEHDRAARVGLIHRLDREASGLLIFSKNAAAYRSLKTQFFKHAVERVYVAVVHGVPEPDRGKIVSRLVEGSDGVVRSTQIEGKGQRAVTEFETQESNGKLSLLRIRLHTGRKHQIRSQLAERGFPVVGDSIYGGPIRQSASSRLLLHALELGIIHPRTSSSVRFSASVPAQFDTALRKKAT